MSAERAHHTGGSKTSESQLPAAGGGKARSIVLATAFFDMMGAGIALPILPLLKQAFDASGIALSLLIVMFPLAQIVMSPVLGGWSDRIGRYRIIQATLIGTSLCHLLFAFLPSLALLIVLRLVAGAFAGGIAVARAFLLDLTPGDEAPKALGRFGMAASMGFIAGLILSGLVIADSAQALDYTKPFIVAAAIGFALSLAAGVFLRASGRPAASAINAPAPSELFRKGLARLSGPGIAYLALCMLAAALFGMLFFIFPIQADALYGWTPRATAAAFILFTAYIAIVQGFLVGPASRLVPWTTLVGLMFALFAAGYALQLTSAAHWALAIAAALGVITANSLAQPMLAILVIGETQQDAQGQSLGWVQSASGVGAILGPLAGGIGLDHLALTGPALIAIILALAGLTILLAAHAAKRREGVKA